MFGIEPAAFAGFIAGALILNLTPGPDMAFTLATTARGGARAGFLAAVGVACGSLLWAVLTAGGVAALLAASAPAMAAVRIIGGVYLLYLAQKTWRHRRKTLALDDLSANGRAFRDGFLTNLFNPKVGLFFLAFLPAFVSQDAGPLWPQLLFLGAVFSLSGGAVLAGVAAAAGAAQKSLAGSASLQVWLNSAAAGVFAAMGCLILFTRAR